MMPSTRSRGAQRDLLRAATGQALHGEGIDPESALALANLPDASLPDLFAAAREVRRSGKGAVVTYSPKVFIPLTQLCRDHCTYCTFRREPADLGGHLFMSPEEVLAVARAGERRGCREALFTLGERPEQRFPSARSWLAERGYKSTIDYLVAMCDLVLRETKLLPHSNPGTLTASEMRRLREVNASLGMMLESVSLHLMEPGQPHHAAPSKHPRARLATIERAGALRVPFTTGLLLGLGDRREDQIDGLSAIRESHRRHGHVQEVIIQNFRAKPGTGMAGNPEPSEREVMRIAAVARLLFGSQMNIQIPPNLAQSGYGAYLDAGINDWGGISPVTPDFVNPEAPWPEISELSWETAERGLGLRARYPVYPEYILRGDEYLAPRISERLRSEADQDGYPPEMATSRLGRA